MMPAPDAARVRLRVVIVDDEPLAREGLRTELSRLPGVIVVAEAEHGREAVAVIRAERPDLVFLDVQMPEMDGFGVLDALEPEDVPDGVVFVTAYEAHAVKAFEVQAIDYVLKPYRSERIAEAVARASERILEARALGLLEAEPAAVLAPPADPARYWSQLVIRERDRTIVVPVDSIEWIEARAYYARLHLPERALLLRERMGILEQRLDPARFFRSHRSAIVRLDLVREIRADAAFEPSVLLATGVAVPLSRARRRSLERVLDRR